MKVKKSGSACCEAIVARFFAVLFVHLFLLLAGLTGFLLLLLLLASLLLTAVALQVLLFTLLRHPLLLVSCACVLVRPRACLNQVQYVNRPPIRRARFPAHHIRGRASGSAAGVAAARASDHHRPAAFAR
jgi:hypothetical protein